MAEPISRSIRSRQFSPLFVAAQKQELHFFVGKQGQIPGLAKLAPGIIDRSPALAGLNFLHIEAGSHPKDIQTVCDALKKGSDEEAIAGLSQYGINCEIAEINGQRGVIVKDAVQHAPVSESDYLVFQEAMETFHGSVRQNLQRLEGSIHTILSRNLDWRKKGRRGQLLDEVRGLSAGLGDLSMAVSAYPYAKDGMGYGAARVPRWRDSLFFAARQAASIKSFAETYFRFQDLTATERIQNQELVAQYQNAVAVAREVFSAVMRVQTVLRAARLARTPDLELFLLAQEHPVIVKDRTKFALIKNGEIAFAAIETGSSFFDIETMVAGLAFPGLALARELLGGDAQVRVFTYTEKASKESDALEKKALIARDALEQNLVGRQDWLRMRKVRARLAHDIKTPVLGVVGYGSLVASKLKDPVSKELKDNLGMLLSMVKVVGAGLEDLAHLIKLYSGREGSLFSGLTRVASWRESIHSVVREAAAIKAFAEHYLSAESCRAAGVTDGPALLWAENLRNSANLLFAIMLTTRDYVEGVPFEHGQKVSVDELRTMFEKKAGKDIFQLDLAAGFDPAAGFYASPYDLTEIVVNLTSNMRDHGDAARPGIRLMISREGENIRIQVRNFGLIREDMLTEAAFTDINGNKRQAQRIFLRGRTEKAEAKGQHGIGGETIREIVEFMQGSVRAFNENEEAVIELTFKYAE